MNDEFTFDDIAGQTATLTINSRDSRCVITWGDLTIVDEFGDIGFWVSFHKKHFGTLKGAALAAALRRFAKSRIDNEIYHQFRLMQEELANA
jgi:hypothetical protein